MQLLGIITLAFLGIRFLVSLGNWLSQPRLQAGQLKGSPKVSILIPARNEAHNLPHLFSQLKPLSYPHLEILILDDHSEDETAILIQEAQAEIGGLSYRAGAPLPADWLGKNWACHQLGQAATGDFFLFLDADIHRLKPGFIEATIAEMEKKQLSLLSLFPNQLMITRGEQLVVPIMHYLLLSLLPLAFIYRLPFPSMAAANGQFMCFRAEDYRQHQWHQQVKQVIVEDIAIMQTLKKAGKRGMTFVGNAWVHTRMYQNFQEGIEGFSKNMLSGFGNQIWGLLVYVFFMYFAWVVVWPAFPPYAGYISIALMLGIRAMISDLADQPILRNLLLHPLQMAILVWIGGQSIRKKWRGKNEWKGRNLQLQ
ncbi:MAG: glycosyltransferase family 2 protein [Bacteroidota bacterium]